MSNSTAMATVYDPSEITPVAILFRTLALIALVLDLPPLIWHLRGRNLAASTLVLYIMLDNFMNFTNSLIWPTDDVSNWWPGYGLCDIEVKLITGTWIGVISCLLCILRDLARVLDTERTVLSLSRGDRVKRLVIDCLLCFGAPVYMMLAHYVLQSYRYYILGIVGCTAAFDPSWPRIPLIFIWPPVLCLFTVYYAVLVIIRIIRYKRTFSAILASSSSTLTKSRFLRLFCMALSMIIVVFPVSCYILYRNSTEILVTYSWLRVHGPDSREIVMVPAFGAVSFDHWIQIAAGFLVFFFFGMGKDAVKGYRKGLVIIGLGRLFPSLKREGSGVESFLASQGSGASRMRLLSGRKLTNPFSRRRDSSLPTYSPRSHFSSSTRSPTQTISTSSPPTGIAELPGRLSGSTAPSTPYSSEKYLVADSQKKETWLKRYLVATGITRIQRQTSNSMREMEA